jgi:hypothetical protein
MRISYLILTAALSTGVAQSQTGRWMIDTLPGVDEVQLTLHRADSTNSHSVALSGFRGLTRAQMDSSTGQTLRFEIVHEAGTLNCEGYFKSGNGAGAFTFAANPSFVAEMHSLGHNGLTPDQIFSMAVFDIGPKYVRELKDLGYQPTADELFALKIHGVTVEFIRDLKALGYHPTIDQLVSLRIHGATTEFVKQIKDLGYGPTIDELVSMRIHGVTPDYIHDLRSHGMKNLSIDQLVSLKIHGISD